MHVSILLEPNKLALNLKAVNADDKRLITALHEAIRHMNNGQGRFHFTNNLPKCADSTLNGADVTLALEPEPSQTATEAREGHDKGDG